MALKIKSSPVANEGEITANNIIKLKQKPVQGNFDAEHLKEINRRVLEGIPSYNGGLYRLSEGEHVRSRSIEGGNRSYVVHYKYGGVKDQDINTAIKSFGPIKELSKLPQEEFAKRLSKLYGDLDHIHPFNEANSRTLRLFTEQIAKEAGHKLDWPRTNLNKEARDELYKARDMEVSKRSHPNLTIESMRTASASQIEAYETQKILKGSKSLEQVFKENISHARKLGFEAKNPNPYLQGKSLSQTPVKATKMQTTNTNNLNNTLSRGKR